MSQSPQIFPEPFVIHPRAAHISTVILLHGRGSSGNEFADDLFECQIGSPSDPLAKALLPDRFPNCKWIFPSTKKRYSTTFQEEWPEWFDTVSLTDPSQREDLQMEGLSESVLTLKALIDREATQVKPSNIILGGISQGYATAIHVLMALDMQLAGFVGLSGWMPFAKQIKEAVFDKTGNQRASGATDFVRSKLGLGDVSMVARASQGSWKGTPIFLGHELHDEVVSCDLGKEAAVTLAAAGANPVWHTYDSGEHWLKEPEEVEDLVEFIDQCLPQASQEPLECPTHMKEEGKV
ncbi:MAG: hypothetical protein Q9225_006969 [Loekoesia sp. 1 TL-2023]